MKKLIIMVLLALVMLTGCGVKEERNYYFTIMGTGEQLHGITETEYKKLESLYEQYRSRELQDLMDELKQNPEVTVTWDEDLRNVTTWDNADVQTW